MATAKRDRGLQQVRRALAVCGAQQLPDRELLRRFAHGHDQDAFAAVVRRHGAMVLNVCRRALHNSQDAEDVFQATFLTLARRADARDWAESVAGWLYVVAYRLALRARAREARRAARQTPTSPSAPTDPLEAVSGRELCAALDQELSRLPREYRLAVVLCCLEGLARDEAARRLGWSLGTLKRRLAQGRALLRSHLARRGFAPAAVLSTALLAEGSVRSAPADLVRRVAGAAAEVVAGRTLARAVSARVFGLAGRSKVAVLLLLAICAAGVGLGLTLGTSPADPPPAAEQKDRPPPAQKKLALDLVGDALPPRALARAGTVRLRHGETLAFFPDGKTLVAGGRDGAVRLWDVATGRERLALPGHKGGVWSVAVSRDGKILVSGGVDAAVRVWDAATGKQRLAITGLKEDVWSVAVSPDGKTVTAGDRSGRVRLWDVATGKLRRELARFNDSDFSVTFSPDGNTLAALRPHEDQVLVWDLATGKESYRLSFKEHVHGVQFSPDGRVLAVQGKSVHLYDAFTGTERRRLSLREGSVAAVAFSPDSKTVVASGFVDNPEVRFWNVRTGKERPAPLRRLEGGAPALVFSPDGKTLASSSTEWVIRLTDVETGRDRLTFQAHTASVQAVAFTPDGKSLLTGGDRTVRFWDPTTGRPQRLLEHTSTPVSFAFSPDGKTLAAGGGDPTNAVADKVVRLWELASGKPLRDLRGKTGMENIRSIAFSADGRTLAAASLWDGTVRLWDLASGDVLRTLPRHSNGAYAAAFSPDGALLATGSFGNGVRFWAPDGSAERPGLKSGRTFNLAFLPDGATLVTGGDKELWLWDVGSRQEILCLKGHEARVTCVAVSPDGRLLASGSDDRTVRLWSVATGKEVLKLTGHRGFVTSVAFSPDGRLLASGSWDATALVWDIADVAARPDVALHLTLKEQGLLWQALAGADPAAAHRAVWSLVRAGRQGVAVIRERLRATDLPSAQQMEKWLADLDSDRFAVRQKASRELEKLGRMAEPALRRLLAGRPPLEVRRRAEELLSRLERQEIAPELLRVRRAVRVLESVDTPEGRRMLEELSRKGVAEATAALRRLPVRSP